MNTQSFIIYIFCEVEKQRNLDQQKFHKKTVVSFGLKY